MLFSVCDSDALICKCIFLFFSVLQTSSTSTTAPQTPADSSIDSQTDTAFGSEDVLMSEPPNDAIKKSVSNDQSDTTSLQKETKEISGIAGEAFQEKKTEAMKSKNTEPKTPGSGPSLNAPNDTGTSSTYNTSESKKVFEETSIESKAPEDAFIAKSCKENLSKDGDKADILTEHPDSNQKQSETISAIHTKPSDDLPEAFLKTETTDMAHIEVTSVAETPSKSEKTILETQGAESKTFKSTAPECSKSDSSSSFTGKSTESTSAVGECSKSEVSLSLSQKLETSDSPSVENSKQGSTLSLVEGSCYTEPAKLDSQRK